MPLIKVQLLLCITSRHSSHTAPPNLHLYIRCRCKRSFVPSHFIRSTHQTEGSAGCTANMDILGKRKISRPWQQSHPTLVTHSLGYPNTCTSLLSYREKGTIVPETSSAQFHQEMWQCRFCSIQFT